MNPSTRHGLAQRPARSRLPARMAGGCSLVESLCSLAIVLVLLSGVLPMLQDLMARQALLAQAAELETDLALARAQAQLQGQTIRFAVLQPDAGGSCYIIHSGPAGGCQCTGGGRTSCEAGAQVLRLVEPSRRTGIKLAAINRSLAFDAGMGTVTPTATLRLTDRDGRAVHQVINLMGRVRTCTPNPVWGGMRHC